MTGTIDHSQDIHNSNGLKGPYNLLHFPFACILTLISERILYAVAYTINQSPSEKTQTGAVAKNSYSKISKKKKCPSTKLNTSIVSSRLRDSRVRKRGHTNKTRGDWGEDWRRISLPLSPLSLPPPPPGPPPRTAPPPFPHQALIFALAFT